MCTKVLQYDLQGNYIKEWNSIKEVKKQFNIYDSNLIACCKGKRKTAGGYKWKYKDAQ